MKTSNVAQNIPPTTTPGPERQLTDEQQRILSAVRAGVNVRVHARAGTGKTSTSLQMVRQLPSSTQCLILTYNSSLKTETRQRVRRQGIHNLRVHSYHSFALQHFDVDSHTDQALVQVVRGAQCRAPYAFDLWILDECQDLTPLLTQALARFMRLNQRGLSVVILGDEHQMIYQFRGADGQFLRDCTRLTDMPIKTMAWCTEQLSVSFRVPQPIIVALQAVFPGMPAMTGFHANPHSRVRYVIRDMASPTMVQEVLRYLRMGYRYQDIFILAPSVRCSFAVRQLANTLSRMHIPIFSSVDDIDSGRVHPKVLKGKIVISTFHSAKGLERKVAIVMGIDASYDRLMLSCGHSDDKGHVKEKGVLHNPVYVAITRASEQLTLVHHCQEDYMSSIDRRSLATHCDFCAVHPLSASDPKTRIRGPINIKKRHVTELIRYMPAEVSFRIRNEFLRAVTITPSDHRIALTTICRQSDDLYEDVSNFNGTVIPNLFVQSHIQDLDEALIERVCLQAIDQWTADTGFQFKKEQIQSYEWLKVRHARKCVGRMAQVLHTMRGGMDRPNDGATREIMQAFDFEKPFRVSISKDCELTGRIDALSTVSPRIMLEFKLVSIITTEHMIQTAIYGWLLEKNGYPVDQLILFNILTNEMLRIEVLDMDAMMALILAEHERSQK